MHLHWYLLVAGASSSFVPETQPGHGKNIWRGVGAKTPQNSHPLLPSGSWLNPSIGSREAEINFPGLAPLQSLHRQARIAHGSALGCLGHYISSVRASKGGYNGSLNLHPSVLTGGWKIRFKFISLVAIVYLPSLPKWLAELWVSLPSRASFSGQCPESGDVEHGFEWVQRTLLQHLRCVDLPVSPLSILSSSQSSSPAHYQLPRDSYLQIQAVWGKNMRGLVGNRESCQQDIWQTNIPFPVCCGLSCPGRRWCQEWHQELCLLLSPLPPPLWGSPSCRAGVPALSCPQGWYSPQPSLHCCLSPGLKECVTYSTVVDDWCPRNGGNLTQKHKSLWNTGTLLALSLCKKLVADVDSNLTSDWAINSFVLIDQLAESQTNSRGDAFLGKALHSSLMDTVWLVQKTPTYIFPFSSDHTFVSFKSSYKYISATWEGTVPSIQSCGLQT